MAGKRPYEKSIPAQYMKQLARRITKLNNRIEDDVSEMCGEVLKPFRKDYKKKIESEESTHELDICLKDILRSLTIHLHFHCGVAESSMTETERELAKFESDLNLISNQEEENQEEENQEGENQKKEKVLEFVVDPGSLLLEMVSWEPARKIHNWYWNIVKRECYCRLTREENWGWSEWSTTLETLYFRQIQSS